MVSCPPSPLTQSAAPDLVPDATGYALPVLPSVEKTADLINAARTPVPERLWDPTTADAIALVLTPLLVAAAEALQSTNMSRVDQAMKDLFSFPLTLHHDLPPSHRPPTLSPPPGFEEVHAARARSKRAHRDMLNQNPSRAYSSLTEERPQAKYTADTVSQLRRLHPDAPADECIDRIKMAPSTKEIAMVPTLRVKDIRATIRSKKAGTALDASGFSWELLKAVSLNNACAHALTLFANALVRCVALPHPLLTQGKLNATDKIKAGVVVGVRPTVTGQLLVTMAMTTLLRRVTPMLKAALGKRQTAMLKNGTLIASILAQLQLGSFDDAVSVQLDVSNAYNSPLRSLMLERCRRHCPPLYAAAWFMYSTPSILLINGVPTCISARGAKQGELLANGLYCLVNLFAVDAPKVHPSSSLTVAYCDDTTLVQRREHVADERQVVVAAFATTGQTINPSKEIFFDPSVPNSSTEFFGALVGDPLTVQTKIADAFAKFNWELDRVELHAQTFPMDSLLLILNTFGPRVQAFLNRNEAPVSLIVDLNARLLASLRVLTRSPDLEWGRIMRTPTDGGLAFQPLQNKKWATMKKILKQIKDEDLFQAPNTKHTTLASRILSLQKRLYEHHIPDFTCQQYLPTDAPLPFLPEPDAPIIRCSQDVFQNGWAEFARSSATLLPHREYCAALRIHLGLDPQPDLYAQHEARCLQPITSFLLGCRITCLASPSSFADLPPMNTNARRLLPPSLNTRLASAVAYAIGLAVVHFSPKPHRANPPLPSLPTVPSPLRICPLCSTATRPDHSSNAEPSDCPTCSLSLVDSIALKKARALSKRSSLPRVPLPPPPPAPTPYARHKECVVCRHWYHYGLPCCDRCSLPSETSRSIQDRTRQLAVFRNWFFPPDSSNIPPQFEEMAQQQTSPTNSCTSPSDASSPFSSPASSPSSSPPSSRSSSPAPSSVSDDIISSAMTPTPPSQTASPSPPASQDHKRKREREQIPIERLLPRRRIAEELDSDNNSDSDREPPSTQDLLLAECRFE
jgi:hypothetical protein